MNPLPRHVHRTACNRDCPDACSLLVDVEGERAVRLTGDPDDPVTRGFLCERTAKFLARQYSPDRFMSPHLRKDGRLVPVSYDEALDYSAKALLRIRAESGPSAIFNYRSGGSLGLLKNVVDYLFEQFGPVTIKRGDICSGAGEAANIADFGVSDSNDLFDLEQSRLIVIWGKNVHVSGSHLLPLLLAAKRRGALLVGIDCVRTRMAPLCDLFLQVAPGADGEIALAVAGEIFRRGKVAPDLARFANGVDAFRALALASPLADRAAAAGVATTDLARFASLYADHAPAAILVGWGLARRRNGAAVVRMIDALATVRGNMGVNGGGASYYFARRPPFDLSFIAGAAVAPRTISEPLMGQELLAASAPPVRAIWVTAGNPLSMLPDAVTTRRAFERTEFVAVVDSHPTDTTDVAHVVFPCPTLLEDDDLLGAYGNHWLRAAHPAVAPPPGVRHEIALWRGLAERLGLADRFDGSIAVWKERLLRKLAPHGITAERLASGPIRNPLAPTLRFAGNRFDTDDGRARLPASAPQLPPAAMSGFPLTLMAVSVAKAQSSQWCEPPPSPAEVRIHSTAAAGISDGAPAWLESVLGRMPVVVRHDAAIHPSIAWMAKGGMQRNGDCANVLIRAVLTDAGEGGALYDEPVRLLPR
ncbi:MAG: molybdopterin-containing oxidoreductase catalytic subunit [Planctomycetes bacterium]|nr:molybdopterin-containing oxidoreductase catalytic subunit [Planctomycetota bacterium]